MTETIFRILPFTVAVLPALIVLCYFAVATRRSLADDTMWGAAGFGASSVFPCAVIGTLLSMVVDVNPGLYSQSAKLAFIEAAIPEEIFKLLALLCICWSRLADMSARQIFVYSIACACGFAALENLFYVFGNVSQEHTLNPQWAAIAMARSVSAVPGHAFVGAVMGYCVYRAVQTSSHASGKGWLWWASALLSPILLHGTYDFFLFAIELLNKDTLSQVNNGTSVMAVGFIMVVIAEGAIAHLLLRRVMFSEGQQAAETMPSDFVSRLSQHFALWALIGCLTLGGATLFFLASAIDDIINDQMLIIGFATFALLHGLAFLSLAHILYGRRRMASV
ncbi:PrsW family intramembrane metalloprotease [Cohaesibacter celericrescens]|uniref:PrsW family intramembrane metalloprotease n=1 Tax=Cohaesibacter celericrescens TaxID=2067669 RepID=UPI003564C998